MCSMDSLVSTTQCSLAGVHTHIDIHTCTLPLSLSHTHTHSGAAVAEVGLLFTPFLGCCVVTMPPRPFAPLNIVQDGRETTQSLWRHCLWQHKGFRCRCPCEKMKFVSCAGGLKSHISLNLGSNFESCLSADMRKKFSLHGFLFWLFLISFFSLSLSSSNMLPPSFSHPCFSNPHTVETNERAGAGEGLAAGRSGGGGAGPGLVPRPNPQCHRETAAGRPELPLHGQSKTQCVRQAVICTDTVIIRAKNELEFN